MPNATAVRGAVTVGLTALVLAFSYLILEREHPAATEEAGAGVSSPPKEAPGFLYGRVTTHGGDRYEGRLRWGGHEEAFWNDYFNGVKDENPWAAHTPLGQQAEEHRPTTIFGVEIPLGERPPDLSRPFMTRFGDIARIESHGDGMQGLLADGVEFDPVVRVVLKNGTVFDLDRLSASDFDDGVRVWDSRRGVADLTARQVRTVELLPTARLADAPARLYGTVHTRQGPFTGFLQWDREEAVGRDLLIGRADGRRHGVRFDSVRSIARHASEGSLVTLLDGREMVLSGTQKVGPGHRGIYVDDPRYGRVLVSWDAFERVELRLDEADGSGPSYHDFAPGRPLAGSVTTRAGRRLAGCLVYDLDESETTETLDAPARGLDYTIPFSLIASVILPAGEERARVVLQSGEELRLARAGDLGEANAGLLVFAGGRATPEYVSWADVERIDFDRPLPASSSDGKP